MNWFRTYRAKIDSKDLKVIVCDEEDQDILFSHELREENFVPNFFNESKKVIV